jgi:antitoxin YefM
VKLLRGISITSPPKRGAGFAARSYKTKRESTLEQITKGLDEIQNPEARLIVERGLREVSSDADASSLFETFNLLRSSKNADRLLRAIQRARSETLEAQTPDDLRREFGLVEEN